MPDEAQSLVAAFCELVPGVPQTEAVLKQLLDHFWKGAHVDVKHELHGHSVSLRIETCFVKKRKRGEVASRYIGFDVLLNHRTFWTKTLHEEDPAMFLDHLMHMRSLLVAFREDRLCPCGFLFKVSGGSKCPHCICAEFLK